jgi:hypothetical protein
MSGVVISSRVPWPCYRQLVCFDVMQPSFAVLKYRASRTMLQGKHEVCSYLDRGDLDAWLGFRDTFRTLCIAPSKEIRSTFEQLKAISAGA